MTPSVGTRPVGQDLAVKVLPGACHSLSAHRCQQVTLKQDCCPQVPPGTVVRAKDAEEGEVLAEVLQEGDRALLMMGGRGGRGNASFKSQRNK